MPPRRGGPVKTYGLTHLALAVRDPQVSMRFYQAVIGAIVVHESEDLVQMQTPGTRDVIVFERRPKAAGKRGGPTAVDPKPRAQKATSE